MFETGWYISLLAASFEVGQVHLPTGSIETSLQLPAVEGLQNIWEFGIV